MTEFLLAGTRPAAGGTAEPGLAAAASQLVSAVAWHGWLRRWGLLAGYGLARDPAGEVRACLVVRANDSDAAERLARGWETVTGYRVAVLSLTGVPGEPAERRSPPESTDDE
jgi:hypothetical protein